MATKTYLEELENFLEEVSKRTINFGYKVEDDYILIEYMSSLGEDVGYEYNDITTIDELIDEVYRTWDCFDAEEHATMWYECRGQHGAPTSLRALLEDADEQEKDLELIYDTMKEVRDELTMKERN